MSCINYRIPDVLRYPLLCTLILSLFGCSSEPETVVDSIRARGELLVITRNSPTTFYEGPQGPVGFEYDLLSRFARHLGVKLRLIVPDSFEEILPMGNQCSQPMTQNIQYFRGILGHMRIFLDENTRFICGFVP